MTTESRVVLVNLDSMVGDYMDAHQQAQDAVLMQATTIREMSATITAQALLLLTVKRYMALANDHKAPYWQVQKAFGDVQRSLDAWEAGR